MKQLNRTLVILITLSLLPTLACQPTPERDIIVNRGEGKYEDAHNALRLGISVEDVAAITGLSHEQIARLRANLDVQA